MLVALVLCALSLFYMFALLCLAGNMQMIRTYIYAHVVTNVHMMLYFLWDFKWDSYTDEQQRMSFVVGLSCLSLSVLSGPFSSYRIPIGLLWDSSGFP